MWKLLRNLVLAAIFVAGALKLLAWYAVRQDAQRVIAGLATYGQLQYAGVSAGLNGSVTLDGVSVTSAATHKTYRAQRVTLITPGLHWLLRRALFHENNLPQQFGIIVDGPELPADAAWLNRKIFDPQVFAPFPAVGCGSKDFTAADWRKMGFDPDSSRARVDYHYNDDTHTLNVALTLTAANLTRFEIAGEISRFDPVQLNIPGWLTKLRLKQASAQYTDLGFQQARNRFCARRESISESQFIDRHIAAARALLVDDGVTPNDSLIQLYRTLVSDGGQVNVLSLPSKDFIPGSWRVLGANEVWRQLDVTARYQDSPPIMFGLNFATAPVAVATTSPELAPASTDETPSASVSAAPKVVPTSPSPSTRIAQPSLPSSTAPVPKAAALTATPSNIAAAALRDPIVPAPKPAAGSLGLGGLDRAEAKLAPLTVAPTVVKPAEVPASVMPSSPPPPPNSTMALVWKPVIDELPESAPPARDYTVIDIGRLAREEGRRVRLITNGNVKVEGYVIGIDESGVQLRVDRGGGAAQFTIPRSRIEQVQLLKR